MKSKIPREEWAINKVQMAQLNKDEGKTDTENNDTSPPREDKGKTIGWVGVHVLFL